MQRFSNRTILVTGAGSGIGQAAAQRLATEGATILALDLNQAALEQTGTMIGASYHPYQIDLTDPDQVRSTLAAIGEQIGQIDGAFNAAGASGRRWGDGPVDQCSDQGWQRTLDVNLSSMFYVCRSIIPLLPKAGGAIVIYPTVNDWACPWRYQPEDRHPRP
jgi:NAD(P)-dependent dehydrogenase (short-subunit alcohol dehydrogenase family)